MGRAVLVGMVAIGLAIAGSGARSGAVMRDRAGLPPQGRLASLEWLPLLLAQRERPSLPSAMAAVSPPPPPQLTPPQPARTPTTPTASTLISPTTGVNYTSLRDLLAAGKWREADSETDTLMLQAAGRTHEGWLDLEAAKKFACEDLRIIDQLWRSASNHKFGLSVQSEIYRSLGGTETYDAAIWRSFGDRIGWRAEGNWLNYSNLKFNPTTSSTGELPWGWGGWGWGGSFHSSLFSRGADCNL